MKIIEKTEKFWKWFDSVKEKLSPEIIDEKMIGILNSKILVLGDFDWEIREGINKANLLIISPGGDLNLIDKAKYIISLAPVYNDWEFYYFKPPKDWDFKLYVEKNGGKEMVDASNWTYVLYEFDNSNYDIAIKAQTIKHLDIDFQYDLIDLVLENILGEEMSLEKIKNVEIVSNFDKDIFPKSNSIRDLKSHLKSLVGSVGR